MVTIAMTYIQSLFDGVSATLYERSARSASTRVCF